MLVSRHMGLELMEALILGPVNTNQRIGNESKMAFSTCMFDIFTLPR